MSETEARETAAGERSVARITREFDFDRETVFGMFTDSKKAEKWFGTPEGAETVLFELDARPGGTIRIHDRWPGGPLHRTVGTVVELISPERFAFRSTTTLEEGAAPFEALQTVTLEAIGLERTRVVVVVRVLSPGSVPGGVEDLVQGFTGGWGETLDKLQRELRSTARTS